LDLKSRWQSRKLADYYKMMLFRRQKNLLRLWKNHHRKLPLRLRIRCHKKHNNQQRLPKSSQKNLKLQQVIKKSRKMLRRHWKLKKKKFQKRKRPSKKKSSLRDLKRHSLSSLKF
jgi:hypothetical protein